MITLSPEAAHDIAGYLRRVVPHGPDDASRLEGYVFSLERLAGHHTEGDEHVA